MTFNRFILGSVCVPVSLVVVGCASSGLSRREYGTQTQGAYLTSMFADADASDLAPRAGTLRTPASVAVAQVGEVTPPASMLAELRKQPSLFRRVQPIPAADMVEGSRYYYNPPRENGPSEAERARRQLTALRGLAASSGADYLLLVGGTVDQTSRPTVLSLANLTIVGAFVVPSRHQHAVMKASGAMIDVRSGAVVSLSSAEAEKEKLVTFAGMEGETVDLLDAMRADLTAQLAQAVITDFRSVGGVR